jgi:hypothetical protein
MASKRGEWLLAGATHEATEAAPTAFDDGKITLSEMTSLFERSMALLRDVASCVPPENLEKIAALQRRALLSAARDVILYITSDEDRREAAECLAKILPSCTVEERTRIVTLQAMSTARRPPRPPCQALKRPCPLFNSLDST